MGRVTVSLTGGMGNQMFQYAAARALSLKLSSPLILNISWFRRSFNPNVMTTRHYELGAFPNLAEHQLVSGIPLPTAVENLRSLINGERVVHDANTSPEQFISLGSSQPARLTGYWQNARYFESIKESLQSDFTIDYERLTEQNLSLPQLIAGSTLGIHVRRGDYVTLPTHLGSNQALPESYYQNAIELAMTRRKLSMIVIVSDDSEWCGEKFQGSLFHIVKHGNSSVEDFAILRNCDHHIISNSSFSWWPAWLKPEKNHTVIAPARWYPDGSSFKSIPEGWETI